MKQFYSSDVTNKECERCLHYHMIDSAYGFCRRLPPTVRHPKKKVRHGFKRYIIWEDRYPIVTFDNIVCGEFKGE